MKSLLALICLSLFFQFAIGQTYISTVEDIYWGSLSAEEANYGFYGAEFEIEEAADLISISAYIYFLKNRYDSLSLPTISFEIWSFDGRPKKRIHSSPELQVEDEDLDRWKKYILKNPLHLPKGRYVMAVGQTKVQGFVAFGQAKRTKGYKSQVWMKGPIEGHFDGIKWFTGEELYEKIGKEISDNEFTDDFFNELITMFTISLHEN